MALDPNLYTLHFARRLRQPDTVDIVEASHSASSSVRAPLYIRQRARRSPIYDSILLDGLVDAVLATCVGSSGVARTKTISLQAPACELALRKAENTFAQEWRFEWEGAQYAWRREGGLTTGVGGPGKNEYSCWAIRAPDPNIWIAIYKPFPGAGAALKRASTAAAGSGGGDAGGASAGQDAQSRAAAPAESHVEAFMQLLDHNIARLEPAVADRKGLELVLLMALGAILDQDYDEKYRSPENNVYLAADPFARAGSLGAVPKGQKDSAQTLESLLLKGRTHSFGAGTSADGQRSEPNEVHIEAWGDVDAYVAHCMDLLRDDGPAASASSAAADGSAQSSHGQGLSIILLRASSAQLAQKAVAVAAGVKAAFYRLPDAQKGKDAGEELFQYVRADDERAPGPGSSSAAAGLPHGQGAAPVPNALRPGGRPIIKLGGAPEEQHPAAGPSSSSSPKPEAAKKKDKDKEKDKPYVPPSSLTIYLSKERIAELEPKPIPAPRIPPKHAPPPGTVPALGGGSSSSSGGPYAHRPHPQGFVSSGHAPPLAAAPFGYGYGAQRPPSGHGPGASAQRPPSGPGSSAQRTPHAAGTPPPQGAAGATPSSGNAEEGKEGITGKLFGKLRISKH